MRSSLKLPEQRSQGPPGRVPHKILFWPSKVELPALIGVRVKHAKHKNATKTNMEVL